MGAPDAPLPDVTEDAFLEGRLRLLQPRRGYRAGVDPVLLAAAVPARAGESVLDLGCGVGTAALCLAARVDRLVLHGLEAQPEYAALARSNADANGFLLDVHEGRVESVPDALKDRSFDHVIANPPYFDPARRTAARDPGREMALGGATLTDWTDAATRRLVPGGWLTMILDAAQTPDALAALDERLGDVTLLPLAPRTGRPATRTILTARKGAKGPFRLLSPSILHAGAAHETDGEDYTAEISAILRDGAAFPSLRR